MEWMELIRNESKKDYFKNIGEFVKKDSKEHKIFPPRKDIFKAFDSCPYEETKVIILGQDPYHGPGQAHGLSFSVPDDVDIPPSLKNIFKELKSDLGIEIPANGSLTGWAAQGILLLNTSLTVRQGQAGSHSSIGWQTFTDQVIEFLASNKEPLVFILWGAHARAKKKLIKNESHLILESAHPSPLSAYNGFFGSKPFSQTNEFLIRQDLAPINWAKTNT